MGKKDRMRVWGGGCGTGKSWGKTPSFQRKLRGKWGGKRKKKDSF